ncbi:hypothetical protein [Reichenbachiella sp. MALMAid0571]|uniref:hypothetical protein n=1 Tax=Reichenbachiella sp. MALMAid0571 TaxID=3143939 RepID=UPI0032DF5393
MKRFQEDSIFHDLMKKNILQSPSVHFENDVMREIKNHVSKKSIRANYLISLVFALIATLAGILSGIFIYEIRTIVTETFGKDIFLVTQAMLVLIVLILIDFVINSYLKFMEKNRATPKTEYRI